MDAVEHWIDAHVALLRPFGIAPDSRDWRARLPLPMEDRRAAEERWSAAGAGRPRILVNLYSASADRQWPISQFAELLLRIRERLSKATIVIPTMPGGDVDAKRIAQAAGASAMPLSLKDVTAQAATADLVISPDTAITVIASAFEVPTLALMRKNTEQWIPYRNRGRVAFSDDPRSLNALPTERVVSALDAMIETFSHWRTL